MTYNVDYWGNLIEQPHSEFFGREAVGYDLEVYSDLYYVYYLVRDTHGLPSEIVYIGHSGAVLTRLAAHTTGSTRKVFDRVLLRLCDTREQMLNLEWREIRRFEPTYNKVGTSRYHSRVRIGNLNPLGGIK